MTPLAITSITNFLLAAEVLFLAGVLTGTPKARFSAAWYWNAMLLLLGTGALLGGIDHGFIEPANQPRYLIQRTDWIVLGAVTFALLMATAKQFFSEPWQRVAWIVGLVQFVASSLLVLLVDDFRVVSLNYAPVLLLLLVMNAYSRDGAWQISAGILILIAATGIQALHFDRFIPLDHNGLYHVISMLGVLFLCLGGRRLRTAR